jgi:multicomponent K+:H+ antiporter subunit A
LAGAVALIGLALVAADYPRIIGGRVIQYRVAWVPEVGLEFVLRLDGFAWTFAILVTGIGFLVVLYARYYMSPASPVPRFFSFLLAFRGTIYWRMATARYSTCPSASAHVAPRVACAADRRYPKVSVRN